METERSSKKFYTIIIVIMAMMFAGAGVVSLHTRQNNKTEIKEENNTEVKENNETDDSQENDEDNSNSSPTTDSKIIVTDSYFLNYNYQPTMENCISLIRSTDHKNMSTNFIGAMYKKEISNEYKLFYTLHEYTNNVMDQLSTEVYGKTLEVSASTIIDSAKKIFADFQMPANIDKEAWYLGIFNVVCTEEKCNYELTTASSPEPFTTGYMVKPEINGNTVTVKPIYITYDFSETKTTEDEFEFDVTLYDTETLKPVTEVKNYLPKDGTSEEEYNSLNYDALVTNYNKLETYKYTFTDDYKLISVEKE